jgi:hypothetical protein
MKTTSFITVTICALIVLALLRLGFGDFATSFHPHASASCALLKSALLVHARRNSFVYYTHYTSIVCRWAKSRLSSHETCACLSLKKPVTADK